MMELGVLCVMGRNPLLNRIQYCGWFSAVLDVQLILIYVIEDQIHFILNLI